MPSILKETPDWSPKALVRRASKGSKIIKYEQDAMLGSALGQLRIVAAGLMSSFCRARKAREWEAQVAIARTLCQVQEQRRVLLRIPGPGRDSAAEHRTINVPSAPTLDVEGIMREAAGAMEAMPDAATAPASDSASASSPSTP